MGVQTGRLGSSCLPGRASHMSLKQVFQRMFFIYIILFWHYFKGFVKKDQPILNVQKATINSFVLFLEKYINSNEGLSSPFDNKRA